MLACLRRPLPAISSRFCSLLPAQTQVGLDSTPLKVLSLQTRRYASMSSAETLSDDTGVASFLKSTEPIELREIRTVKRDIRVSPRKLTYLAQQIRGLSVQEALLQMKFSRKRRAEIVKKTVQNAVNLADIRFNIEPENLKIAEAFVTKGTYLKRMRPMGKGRAGIMHHPFSHLVVVLNEYDPKTKPLNRFLTKKLARKAQTTEDS